MNEILNSADIKSVMNNIGAQAKAASKTLAQADSAQKNSALLAMADALWEARDIILSENEKDMLAAKKSGMAASFQDRLQLNDERIKGMQKGLISIAKLDDPVGAVIAQWQRPNGLDIKRVRTPLGVIGVIFESRPNVTADAGALCLKSGNASILRGGSDSYFSTRAIHDCLVKGLVKAELPQEAIQIVPTTDRAAVGEMLAGLNGTIDVIVPRGGRNLVERVQNDARVPVFAHLDGLVHVYVDKSADINKAVELVTNSKMRRTGICGAAETLLFDKGLSDENIIAILDALKKAECEIRLAKDLLEIYTSANSANEEDWQTEYLDSIIAAKQVDGIDGAIAHINRYSSSHTEMIVTEDTNAVDKFMSEIDSAILLHNASTQFADGGEFGMGAEIGIATGKMHARGPIGVEQLTSFKYQVFGDGQTRA